MKILIVEDEPLILMDVEVQLLEAGHEVAVAENADIAVTMLARSMFDLLLTDIDMPGSMDGLQLASAVRERWPPVRLVLMSGKRHPHPTEMPSQARFLSKPLQPTELMKAVALW
ncbi:MAG TPA: response regulator [Gemmataceae bacterium]|nr:response regulator [Gemmataceae bacterium]